MRYLKLIPLFFIFFCTFSFSEDFKQAETAYALAEKAATFEERQEGFNQALSSYLKEKSTHPHYLYNVGNCYYHLSKPGQAIWYYQRALRQDPRNKKIKQNLLQAEKIANISSKKSPHLFNPALLPTSFLKADEKNQVALFLAGFFLVLMSFFIWLEKKVLKFLSLSCILIILCFFLSWSMEVGMTSKEGVFVESAFLKCDAGEHYQNVDHLPTYAGQRVLLLELSGDKKWAKVKLSRKQKGYVPIEKVRFI